MGKKRKRTSDPKKRAWLCAHLLVLSVLPMYWFWHVELVFTLSAILQTLCMCHILAGMLNICVFRTLGMKKREWWQIA